MAALMGSEPDRLSSSAALERYRPYLTVLAHAHVPDPAARDRLDLSGVVQQTFLEAHQRWAEFRGGPDGNDGARTAGWLRRILAHNLADARRAGGRAKRGAGRQQRSLDAGLDDSSLRLGGLLADGRQSSPSLGLRREERAVLLADALARLPEAQREAVLLRHCHGWGLSRIAAHLGRTLPAVAGLLQRGLHALRQDLDERRQKGEL
jgi:RNA polymerase sigma-70 factor, ECF subfamily